jgi:glutamine amidotransferase
MIVIIDYGMGNIGSVKNAVSRLDTEVVISNKKDDIERASHLILPGVGAFGDGMKNLQALDLMPILEKEIFEKRKPILGICLGMQLFADEGEEGGLHKGLSWIRGRVRRFHIDEKKFRIPHMGWDDVSPREGAVLFRDVSPKIFYFVHSYFLVPAYDQEITAFCTYGEEIPAAIQKENIFGVQFHPEKSQKSGFVILQNFIGLPSPYYV